MACALLVANEDVVEGRELAERVISWKDGAAGIAEDMRGSFAANAFPENFCTGLFHNEYLVASTEYRARADSSLRSE
jgi:hypothetical protein